MRKATVVFFSALLLLGTGCDSSEEIEGGEGGEGGGGSGSDGDTIDSSNAEFVMRNLVQAVRAVVPYEDSDNRWRNETVEGYHGGSAVVDGELNTSGDDDYMQLTLDTTIDFRDFCQDEDVCFDGDVEYAGWIEYSEDRRPEEYLGGWAVQGSVDVVGTFDDTIHDMEIMIVAHDRTYGWIRVRGTTYDL